MMRFIYALKEIRACLEAELLTSCQHWLLTRLSSASRRDAHVRVRIRIMKLSNESSATCIQASDSVR